MANALALKFIMLVAGMVPAAVPGGPVRISEGLVVSTDTSARMTVPVLVNGHGPFPFIVDTGADRTVIARELADSLGLPRGPPVMLNDTIGVSRVDIAHIATLRLGSRDIPDVRAALLAERHIGASGMLGIDSLAGRLVVIDLAANRIIVEPPEAEPLADPGAIVVRARRQAGQLVMVDAGTGGVPIGVVLDTGAETSIGNPELQRLLMRRRPARPIPTQIISVTGRTAPAEIMIADAVELGGVTVRNVPIAFADLHSFRKFGLSGKPALLLGMDVLRQFERVVVDFKRRKVRLMLPRKPASE